MKKKKFLFFIYIFSVLCLSGIVYSQEDSQFVQYEMAKEQFKKGITFYNEMNYLAAVEYFRQAVSMYSDYHTAREYLARSYKLAGYNDLAATEWDYLFYDSNSPYVKQKIDIINNKMNIFYEEVESDKYIQNHILKSNEMKEFRFSMPSGIKVDNENNIYLTSFKTGHLVKLNNNYKGVKIKKFASDSVLYGLDNKNDLLVVTDFKLNQLYFVDRDLNLIKKIGKSGYGKLEFNGPQGICFDDQERIFIVDSGNNRVQILNKDGEFVSSFGKKGKYKGSFNNPTDIKFYNNKLFVSDTGNKRICIFDKYGNYINELKNEKIELPRGISLRDNKLYICDMVTGMLIYNFQYRTWTKLIDSKDEEVEFSRLIDMDFDRYGNVFTLDHNKEQIKVYTPVNKIYNNLDVNITSIDTRDFPIISVFMTINDSFGNPVYNLSENNFRLIEDNAKVPGIYTGYFKNLKKGVDLVVAVEKSNFTKNISGEVEWSATSLLNEFTKDDRIMVINYNSDYWVSNKFDWSVRRSIRAINEDDYGLGNNIGKTVYNSISKLIKSNNKRGVVVITSGNVDEFSFSKYNVENIISFAKSHYIPVYFVCTETIASELNIISKQTGGTAINISDAESTKKIHDDLLNREEYRYSIVYKTYKSEEFSKWWADIEVDVEYQGKNGTEWSGYFVP